MEQIRIDKNNTSQTLKREYYDFGEKIFGPFLYGFTQWLYDSIKKSESKKVFFFSRDGYMMEKAFREIDSSDVDIKYAYFSRKSLRRTLLWDSESYEDSLKYLAWDRFMSIARILDYYGFSTQEQEIIGQTYNVDLQYEIPYEHIKREGILREIYKDNRSTIIEKSKEQSDLLSKYLEQISMTGSCAIVDIGWHGSMQYYLEQFILKHHVSAKLEGYYVGIQPNNSLQSKVNGYMYDPDNSEGRKKMLCFFGVYEKLFQGFDGSTDGYALNNNNKVVPVFKEFEYDVEKDKYVLEAIAELQRGALMFVRTAFLNNLSSSKKQLSEPIVRFGMHPSLEDTKLFSDFYNVDGNKYYYTAQKKLFEYGVKEFIHALSNSPWKTGFMKSAFKIPFPYYMIYELLKK